MSSAPTQLAVAPSASSLVTQTSQMQKDFLEDPLTRQNSLGNRVRGGLKGKHLTRSHAMRESASPPRTPTPRSADGQTTPVSGFSSPTEIINDSNVHIQSSSSSTSPSLEAPSVIVTSQHPQQQQLNQIHSSTIMYSSSENSSNCGVVCNQSQLDVDFPKLTPPKSSKVHRNMNNSRESSEKQLNVNDTNKMSYNSMGMCATGVTDAIQNVNSMSNNVSNKIGENDKMNCHVNNSNNNNNIGNNCNANTVLIPPSHTISTGTMQSPLSHQRRNQSSPPSDHNENDASIISNLSGLQMTSSPPHLCFDKENRCPRNGDGQNCSNSCAYLHDENRNNMSESPTDSISKCERMGKKHRSGANAKSSKPRLKNMGSSSSVEGGNSTSGFISRDSSTEQFTDQSGVDLVEFFKDTLFKNPRDRNMLMKIEKDLMELAQDRSFTFRKNEIQYPAMSSYNRMLIHRVAAFFGMEHNVDPTTQQCVIVATTKATRIPSIRFKTLLRDRMSEAPKKSILKRDVHSFDDTTRQGLLGCPDRGMLDRKAKSYEEREEEYKEVRRRIFRGRDGEMTEENVWHWSSSDSSDQSAKLRQNNKLLKVQSLSVDTRHPNGRPAVSKSHSFGGYGGPPPSGGPLARGDSINSTKSAGPRLFSKQDSIGSTNTPWRLSPSSSGSIYRFDPSNPPSQAVTSNMYNSKSQIGASTMHRKKIEKQKPLKSESHNCNNNSNNTSDSIGTGTVTIESSVENLSESSAQTVLNIANRDVVVVNDEQQETITKDNHIHRDMSDIQEESGSQTNEDKPATNIECLSTEIQQKPKLINQATSPNIPSPEPDQSTQINEVTVNNNSSTDSNPSQSSLRTTSNSSSTVQEIKKDDPKVSTSTIPMMNYAPSGYQAVDSNAVFSPAGNGPFPGTTYQQGPDGSVYAVPQPMVYAYPPPMEGDFQSYFMPVYDQTVAQRDGNGLVSGTAQTIYQPAGGATAVVPVAYPTAPYGGASIYQGQVVYSPDQFGATGSGGQLQQYPMSYPVGYPYPYNGYWGQTMTYYLPQPPLGSAVPSAIIPQPMPAPPTSSSTNVGNPSHNNSGNSGKRSSPPQQNLSSGHNSQSTTPASTYQFAPGVPLALAADPNGPTMYAIPQSAVFPNMIPYAPPGTPSAAGGVISHLPHHQHNAVINPLISTHPSGHTGPPIPLDSTSCGGYALNNNGSHGNNSGTPHSAPSTPLSNPLPLPHPQRNPPLFATPPTLPNGYNGQMHNHYPNFSDAQNGGSNNYSSYDRKNSNNNKRGNSGGYNLQNNRQNSYNSQNPRKPNLIGSISGDTIINSIPQNGNRPPHNICQQKRINNNNDKSQSSGGAIHNNNNISNAQNNSDKPRTAGVRPKPSNLDLRRSASQRNSPSTNSVESNNNSPNSIASNHMTGNTSVDHPQSMYITRGTHIPPMHPPTAAAVVAAAAAANDAACHQQLIGAYNHPAPAGMYIKYGQTYFTHPPVALPNNRRSPPNDLRPPLPQLTGVYPTMMLPANYKQFPAPRHMQPRHPNPNYKGNKPSR